MYVGDCRLRDWDFETTLFLRASHRVDECRVDFVERVQVDGRRGRAMRERGGAASDELDTNSHREMTIHGFEKGADLARSERA